ncbi:uncharacterized protein N7479_000492 [Penicillium vulpinum]|uniref:uncharacterized protein n=1 Tax=Penicillium vulpinum TaxID=29845 RepID=UPI002547D2F2|nr:uncharacterized protein N7479_000492 [Penicillium vulpinum]KAJ5970574.1 hypothetical protein N7479_000492 [Penicillium vulpinum]
MCLECQKGKSDIKSNPQHHRGSCSCSSVQSPSVSVSEKQHHSLPNNRAKTARTGLPPRPSARITLAAVAETVPSIWILARPRQG